MLALLAPSCEEETLPNLERSEAGWSTRLLSFGPGPGSSAPDRTTSEPNHLEFAIIVGLFGPKIEEFKDQGLDL